VGRVLEQVEKLIKEWIKPALDNDESRDGIESGMKADLAV
jgi:hypothetical protein